MTVAVGRFSFQSFVSEVFEELNFITAYYPQAKPAYICLGLLTKEKCGTEEWELIEWQSKEIFEFMEMMMPFELGLTVLDNKVSMMCCSPQKQRSGSGFECESSRCKI